MALISTSNLLSLLNPKSCLLGFCLTKRYQLLQHLAKIPLIHLHATWNTNVEFKFRMMYLNRSLPGSADMRDLDSLRSKDISIQALCSLTEKIYIYICYMVSSIVGWFVFFLSTKTAAPQSSPTESFKQYLSWLKLSKASKLSQIGSIHENLQSRNCKVNWFQLLMNLWGIFDYWMRNLDNIFSVLGWLE